MKIVLQRVIGASVSVNDEVVGKIGKGYLVLLGIGGEDTKELVEKYVDKISKLRLFEDEEGKTNLSIGDVEGEILVVSQFTLYADCKKNRPSFSKAAPPAMAEELYEYFLGYAQDKFKSVQHGVFGEYMMVSLENDGPFTVILGD
ncbi:MAG: D-aminoacyl-tRNA deacylase [Eubacteriales bacterium]|nr:D-aminoacyl-tRNA deacylase [Eubacteriales bacterium]